MCDLKYNKQSYPNITLKKITNLLCKGLNVKFYDVFQVNYEIQLLLITYTIPITLCYKKLTVVLNVKPLKCTPD